MANTNPLYQQGHPLRYTTDCTRAALLYVAGRFMAVRIDYCGTVSYTHLTLPTMLWV